MEREFRNKKIKRLKRDRKHFENPPRSLFPYSLLLFVTFGSQCNDYGILFLKCVYFC